ncbi:hypothetical protein H696_00041 [Fonticula alba]|uniref:RRM domain-containing protein n=1 Tax=Fonticula alba TaxID=691883 RepID=A0A058ZDH7_FONAL|nr:hypothetical protein H696_00041 [Fonticula alba]KCV72449.1 hypothetical protein H696_00041 [Fonticula alba]|eukprot:XP_009492150.1 hypothetical protein H696_00041 [Fonticula alba]
MSMYMPPALMEYFAPMGDLPTPTQLDRSPECRRGPELTPIADALELCKDNPVPPLPEGTPVWVNADTRRALKKSIHDSQVKQEIDRGTEEYKNRPQDSPEYSSDAFKTLFVGRLPYSLNEAGLSGHFEKFGRIRFCRIVRCKRTGKSRGYGFIEFSSSSDLTRAFREGDSMHIRANIEGYYEPGETPSPDRTCVVDVERGRTVANWLPRRLGKGLGSTRRGAAAVNQKHPGRDGPPETRASDRSAPVVREHSRDRYRHDRADRGGYRGDRHRR